MNYGKRAAARGGTERGQKENGDFAGASLDAAGSGIIRFQLFRPLCPILGRPFRSYNADFVIISVGVSGRLGNDGLKGGNDRFRVHLETEYSVDVEEHSRIEKCCEHSGVRAESADSRYSRIFSSCICVRVR